MTYENPGEKRPPYLLGLLCLIPLVGAFVGLGLLLYGIFKYKDKWLIMIGAFGIVFTIVIYSSLFYGMKHSDVFKQGFASISQLQLTSLVKSIEFYKLQNGSYPDSLPQLLESDALTPINDPLVMSPFNSNSHFKYYRVGEKYRLFSSGIDGIPGTKDDLYPRVRITDSSKIGLIR